MSKFYSSVSFRSLSEIFAICSPYLNTASKTPSYQTGLLWVKKLGYYHLHQPKKKAKDWIVIADESICIGQEKILVILGIRRSEIDFTRSLKMQDLKTLLVKSKESWTGEAISEELKIIKEQVGNIIYGVSDACSNLKKGFREAEISQVFDITHSIAIALEKIYKDNSDFKDFTSRMAQMRSKLCCTKFAHLIPPNQRVKSRFLNIDIITDWGVKVLNAIKTKSISSEEENILIWVKEKQNLIVEMNILVHLIKQISVILKTSGLSKSSKRKCVSILGKCNKGRLEVFCSHIIKYMEDNIKKIKKKSEKLLCCTDIIESFFGRFKNEISKNPMIGITDLALIIPALTSDLSVDTINKAIDFSTVKQIKKWNEDNLCISLLVKRNKAFCKKEGEKNNYNIAI